MAQLKDTVVQGSLRVTDTTYTTNLNLSSGTATQIVKTDANKNLITGTLTTSEIPNLSANKITSDTLNAARIPTLSITDKTSGTLTVGRGGTNLTSITQGGVIYAASTSAYGCTSAGTANQILVSGGTGAPTWKATASGAAYATSANGALTFGTLPIAQGGTGLTSADPHKVLIGPLTGSAAAPTWREPTYMDMKPIATKTYTNVIATANDQNGAGFFYLKIRGNTFNDLWYVKVHVKATVPNQAAYNQDSIYEIYGCANSYTAYRTWNSIRNTGARPIYYHCLFRTNETGYNNNCGTWMGFSLLSAHNNTNSSYKRTVVVDLLEYNGCTIDFQDSLVTPTNIPDRTSHTGWYTSTNTGYDNFDGTTQGNTMTGDRNSINISNLYNQYGGDVAATFIGRYHLVFEDINHKFISLQTVDASTDALRDKKDKTLNTSVDFDPCGRIYYYNSTGTNAANSNIDPARLYYAYLVDLRFAFNMASSTTTGAFTGTRYLPLYLKTSMTASTGMVHVTSSQPFVTSLPNSNDGYYYIYLGQIHDWYRVMLERNHPVYYHDGSKIVRYLGKDLSAKTFVTTDLRVNGPSTFNGNIIGTASNYGDTLPSTNLATGRIFFQTSDPTYELPIGGSTGQALVKSSNATRDVTWADIGVVTPNNTEPYYVTGSTSHTENTNNQIFNTNIQVSNSVLLGAAWNDYAEYRTSNENEPGRCIIENGDGTLSRSTQRLQVGAEIISDTFGFAIGKIEGVNTPIACSGRVLAYPYENKLQFQNQIGKPVCSGPNGTVSIMTEEEEMKYPSRIIGTISEVPSYEEWGTGKVKVNGRVWIRIR